MKKILAFLMMFLCFNTIALAAGEPTIIARAVTEKNLKGVIPEADGITNETFRTNINRVLRQKATALAQLTGQDAVVNYEVVLNRPTLFSIILTAENSTKKLYQGVNIDVEAGAECTSDTLFRDVKALKEKTAMNDFVLANGGLLGTATEYGAYTKFIAYSEILTHINISNAERFMKVHRLTNVAFGSEVTVQAGEPLGILLVANRSTGYTWKLGAASKAEGIIELGKAYVMSSAIAEGKTGTPGLDIVFVGALKPGIYNIRLEYARSWDKYPLDTGEFRLVVK